MQTEVCLYVVIFSGKLQWFQCSVNGMVERILSQLWIHNVKSLDAKLLPFANHDHCSCTYKLYFLV